MWLKEGNRNTRYFHASASAWRRQNSFESLHNNQEDWCSNLEKVDALIVDYFQDLFTSGRCHTAEVTQCVDTRITNEHNAMLLAPFF